MDEVNEILDKYKDRIEKEISGYDPGKKGGNESWEYEIFRKEAFSKKKSMYESMCNFCEKIIQISPKNKGKLKESIDAVHLKITPKGAASFATIFALSLTFFAIIVGFIGWFVFDSLAILALVLLFILLSLILIKPLTNIPIYIADRWRLKASNQFVLCILYVMMYMRHTSNLEHAVRFAADHVGPPLSLDLRKVLWDVQIGKFKTIKESLDIYLESWRPTSPEFVESFHLIESSLYESTETRRVSLLEKSLEVMLDGTYEHMLHFAHDLRNPVQMLHMLGVVLPILGLVIFPLVGSLLGGSGMLKMYILLVLYNILLPVLVFILGARVISKRPTGYSVGEVLPSDVLKKLKKVRLPGGIYVDPFWFAFGFILAFLIIGASPIIIHQINPSFDFFISESAGLPFLDYKMPDGSSCKGEGCLGPFGIGATLIGLLIPLGLGLGLGWYFSARSKKLMKLKKETKELEEEFSSALFQLGNRIGDGVPAEAAFGEVARTTKGTKTSAFFGIVYSNVMQRGMSLYDAIFDKSKGAILNFPSNIIESSMKILIETAKKGPQIVARTLVGISVYITRIQRVNERLNDLMADITSSMKSQISFLTPIIAGIVVGIGVMIVTIMGGLQQITLANTADSGDFGVGSVSALVDLFNPEKIIPSYFFQLIVGLYVLEVVIILSFLASGVQNGPDRVSEESSIGKHLKNTSIFYFLVALIATLLLTILIVIVMAGFR